MVKKVRLLGLGLCAAFAYAQKAPDCARVTEAVQQRYQHLPRLVLEPTSGPANSCTYTYRDNGRANALVGTMIVTLYGDHGRPLTAYQRPEVCSFRSIPGLGQMAEFLVFLSAKTGVDSNGYSVYEKPHGLFTLYRQDKCVLDIQYLNWQLSNLDYDGVGKIVNMILGPYQPQETPLVEPTAPPL